MCPPIHIASFIMYVIGINAPAAMKPQYRNLVNAVCGAWGIYTSSGDFTNRLLK